MPSQFNEKLQPFADWIKAGNVQQQATESGLQFQIDVTQQGYNSSPAPLLEEITGSISITAPNSSNSANLSANLLYNFFMQGFVLYPSVITLTAAIEMQIQMQLGYMPGIAVNGSRITRTNCAIVAAQQRFNNANLDPSTGLYIEANKHILSKVNTIEIYINLSRPLTGAEQITFDGGAIQGISTIPGLQILHP